MGNLRRNVSEASRQLSEEANRKTPEQEKAIWLERQRTLTIQNQPRTLDAQEWMRSKGVQGRPGSPEWREGRSALLEEYRDKLPPSRDWAKTIIDLHDAGNYSNRYGHDLAVAALHRPIEA